MAKKTVPVKPHKRSTPSPTPRKNPNAPKPGPKTVNKKTAAFLLRKQPFGLICSFETTKINLWAKIHILADSRSTLNC